MDDLRVIHVSRWQLKTTRLGKTLKWKPGGKSLAWRSRRDSSSHRLRLFVFDRRQTTDAVTSDDAYSVLYMSVSIRTKKMARSQKAILTTPQKGSRVPKAPSSQAAKPDASIRTIAICVPISFGTSHENPENDRASSF